MKVNIEIEIPMEESVEVSEILMDYNHALNKAIKRTSPNTFLFRDVETDDGIECDMFDKLEEFKTLLTDNRIKYQTNTND